VTVINPENESGSLAGGFTYIGGAQSSPTITSVVPGSGPQSGGTPIVINGTQFQPGALVTFCGVSVPVISSTTTTINIITPACLAGTATIVVTNPDGGTATSTSTFTYGVTSTPTITGIAPSTGSPSGGTAVVVDGTGFVPGATLKIGCGNATSVVVLNATTITALSPACPAGTTGNVVVTNPDGGTATLAGGFSFGSASPTLTSVTPTSGPIGGGTPITVNGTNFANGATLAIDGRAATNVVIVTPTTLTAVTPAGAVVGAADVVITNPDQATATLANAFTYVAGGPPTDPTDNDEDGLPNDCEVKYGLDPNSGSADDGPNGDPDHDGRTNLQECTEGTHPRGFFTRYLAEGATGDFFDMFIALVNGNDQDAHTLLRYQVLGGGTEPSQYVVVPAQHRRTVNPEEHAALSQASFSTVIESDVQIVAERNMHWGDGRYGSHAETSGPALSTTWFFAEGATHGSFNLFYLLQNPGDVAASVEMTYLRPTPKTPIVKTYTVAAHSRQNIWADQEGPELEEEEFSAKVVSTVPIMAERVMYADTATEVWAAGHASAGVIQPEPQWFFAEGATGAFFHTFFLIANPNPAEVTVRATYLLDNGTSFVKDYIVEGNSRYTLSAHTTDPRLAAATFSAKFASLNGEGIVCERAMWWPSSLPWIEAHNSAGVTRTGTEWLIAQGELGGTEITETYVLVANVSSTTANLRVRVMGEDDYVIDKFVSVPANARLNLRMLEMFPELMGKRFGVDVESLGATPAQITVEASVYASPGGVPFGSGSNAQGTLVK
jgi:hypothetical protein